MTTASGGPQKWALLIGIDFYPNFHQLSGCVNDVVAMKQVLVDSFEFPESNIVQLLNEKATQEGIRVSMEGLLVRVKKDDVVVIQFSGHGSQMRARDKNEADGWDETIVPVDSGRKPLPNRDIRDNEIYSWLQRLATITPNLTLVFDSCHSGGITRDPFGDNGRSVPRDERSVEDLPPSPILHRAVLERRMVKGSSGWLPASQCYTLFAGCRSEELSHEVWTDKKKSHTQGALTYFLTRKLAKARPGCTYRDVFESIAPQVSGWYPSQHPQLEGAWEREIFGLKDFEPMIFVPVQQREGNNAILGGGLASGVELGSTWSVYRGATKSIKGRVRLGTLEVVEARGVTSVARVVAETSPGAVREGTRAVEETRKVGKLSLAVEVVAPNDYRKEGERLLAEIRKSAFLRPVEKNEKGDVRVYLLAPREQAGPGDAVPLLGRLSKPTWAVVGGGDDLLTPLHTVDECGAIALTRENLEKLARYRYALALDNLKGPLDDKVSVALLRRRTDGKWTSAKGPGANEIEYREGDSLALRVTNNSNVPLYLAVLDFGLAGRVALVYPLGRNQDPLTPGRSYDIWTRSGEEVRLSLPKDFPLSPWQDRACGGVETLKVFATTRELNLDLLTQTNYRGDQKEATLERLLSQALQTQPTREITSVNIHAGEDDWTTVPCSFRLKPA